MISKSAAKNETDGIANSEVAYQEILISWVSGSRNANLDKCEVIFESQTRVEF